MTFGLFVLFLLGSQIESLAAEKLKVSLNKTEILRLDRPAAVVSVANPAIADVNVQSPTVVIVTGKSLGETTLNILDRRQNPITSYDIVVAPSDDDQVTVNLGADAVKTLSCQPRCVRVSNPGKDPEPSKSGGGAASAASGLVSKTGGGAKK